MCHGIGIAEQSHKKSDNKKLAAATLQSGSQTKKHLSRSEATQLASATLTAEAERCG